VVVVVRMVVAVVQAVIVRLSLVNLRVVAELYNL
jgi:hypothetical protein